MNSISDKRPVTVKGAILVYLLDMALQFIDAFRYQFRVSPDYFDIFWLIGFPVFLIGLISGLVGLMRRRYVLTTLAPMVLIVTAFYSVDRTPPFYRPSAWPTPIPQWVHLALIALLLLLLFMPASVEWYRRRQ